MFFDIALMQVKTNYSRVNYSPIIAPMLALAMLWASTWLMTIPLRLSLVLGEDFDPPLKEEESHGIRNILNQS